ncbi:hypothetical protein [Methylibium petroleiphilum]|nr:hypothetical protein [Methylibium petroleiphilum]
MSTPQTIEDKCVGILMQAARELITMQGLVQPEDVPALRASLRDAHEIRVEMTFGAFPHLRVVTVDTQGNDTHLLRRIELQLPSGH